MRRIGTSFMGFIAALAGIAAFNPPAFAESVAPRQERAAAVYKSAGFSLHYGKYYGHRGHKRHGYRHYGPYRHFGKHRWYGKRHHSFRKHHYRHRYYHNYKPRHHRYYKRYWGHRYRHHYRPGYRFYFSF